MRGDAGYVQLVTGVSRAQLLHWRRIGLVWPSTPADGRGRPALFDDEDIAWIEMVLRLVNLGIEPGAILKAANGEGMLVYAAKLKDAADHLGRAYPPWLDSLRKVLDSA